MLGGAGVRHQNQRPGARQPKGAEGMKSKVKFQVSGKEGWQVRRLTLAFYLFFTR